MSIIHRQPMLSLQCLHLRLWESIHRQRRNETTAHLGLHGCHGSRSARHCHPRSSLARDSELAGNAEPTSRVGCRDLRCIWRHLRWAIGSRS